MSLLDKKKGLAMLPALFLLFACEEPSELGIGLNPKEDEISTHYLEFPVEATQIRIDTIVSSSAITVHPNSGNITGAGSVLIGKANDPVFGTVTATAFSNISIPWDSLPEIDAGAGVDSILLSLNVGNNYIGNNISSSQDLKVFRMQEAIQPTSGSVTTKGNYRYFITDKDSLAEEIGQITFDTSDISNSYLNIRLDNNSEFANELLDKLKTDKSVFSNQQEFNELFGGLAIVPGENSSFINSYFLTGSSRLNFYYGGKTAPISFLFIPKPSMEHPYVSGDLVPTYFNLETDYHNTIFEGAPTGNNVEFQNPDNQVYFRAGVGLLPKFTFSGLEEFVNSNSADEIIINQAILVIDSVFKSNTRDPLPEQAIFYFVDDENNKRFGGVTKPYAGDFLVLKKPPLINSEKDTINSYNADLTEEIEMLVQTQDSRYLQGIVNPATSTTSLLNFIAEPKRIVLKVVYTRLKNQNSQDN